jgi:rare lipoprotein A
MNAMLRASTLAALTLLLAACASAPPADVISRPPAATPHPADTRPAPATPAQPAPAPMPSVTKKGGGYYKDDGPGDNPPPDMASIPDAQPKAEPLHRFANRPYAALGQNYVPKQELAPFKETGIASWYGRRFHGVRTSSGEPYDMYGMTAAHPTLPIPSYARVTNIENGKSVVVRINDRGPFHTDRIIDLSYTAAWKLGYISKGSTRVEVEAIMPEGVAILGKSVPPLAVASTRTDAAVPAPAQTTNEIPATTEAQLEAIIATPAAPAAPPNEIVVADAQPAAPASSLPAGTYLQLGSFSSSRNAESFRDYARQELGKLKQQLYIVPDADKEKAPEHFRLHLGPFDSAAAAHEMVGRVASKLKLKPFVVQD